MRTRQTYVNLTTSCLSICKIKKIHASFLKEKQIWPDACNPWWILKKMDIIEHPLNVPYFNMMNPEEMSVMDLSFISYIAMNNEGKKCNCPFTELKYWNSWWVWRKWLWWTFYWIKHSLPSWWIWRKLMWWTLSINWTIAMHEQYEDNQYNQFITDLKFCNPWWVWSKWM